MVTVALSSLSPIEMVYTLDGNISFNAETVYFNNGLSLSMNSLFADYLDVVINKDNILFLTPAIDLSSIVTNAADTDLLFDDYIGASSIQLSGISLSWDANQGVLGTNDNQLIQTNDLYFIRLTESTSVSATNQAVVYLIDFENGLISIHDTFEQYLTIDPTTYSVSFSAQVVPDDYNYQHFSYTIDGQYVMLFTAISAWNNSQRILYYDTTTGLLSTQPVPTSSSSINAYQIFEFTAFVKTGLDNVNSFQSNWVVYDHNDHSIYIDPLKSKTNTEHSYLISAPFKTIENGILDINLNNLKNYQTPEYDYIDDPTKGPYGRSYNKIIAGTNQDGGYDNIFLTFNADTQELLLNKDKFTYFHFSPCVSGHTLEDSTLIHSGAIASNTPWRSDKIFKKQANYGQYTNWGTTSIQNGTWFCSWLSGNASPDVEPIWMDRYYDPTYVPTSPSSLQSMLLTSVNNDLVSPDGNAVIWDIPSTFTFEPGSLYIYYHVGETRIREIVSNIETNGNIVAKYTTWNSKTITDDTGTYNGDITGFTLSANQVLVDNITNQMYNIGDTFGYIENVDAIFNNDELTISLMIDVDDWTNITGNQIIGNFFNGGIGIFNNNPILTPYITLFDTSHGYVFHLNSNYDVINKNVFSIIGGNNVRQIVKTNYDESYYVLDTAQNILGYDIDNVLQNNISLTSIIPGITVSHMDIDSNYVFHIIDGTSHNYYKVSNAGVLLSSVGVSTADHFALDYNSVAHFPLVSNVIASTFNSTNDFYYSTSSHLYRNDTIIWQASSIEDMFCDDVDNIWILYGQNKIAKLDSLNNLLFSVTTPITGSATGPRSFGYYKELTPSGLNDYVLIFDTRTNYAHKLTNSGTFTSSTPVSAFSSSLISLTSLTLKGTSNNGFDYQRKFIAPTLVTPGISVRAFLREQFINGGTKILRVQGALDNYTGPKHVAVTFNRANGNLKLYIDGVLISQTSFDPFLYRISSNKNNLSLVLGADSSKRDVLMNTLEQMGYYAFDGRLGDIRIFAKELSYWDINALKNSSKTVAFSDITWNIPVGNRNYIEEVEKFFKHKMPGNKSQFYNIKLTGLGIVDTTTRLLIESSIKNVLTRINPVHATLYNIIWE